MLQIPEILNTSEFLDSPLDYKWDEKTSDFYYVDAYNDKISEALWALNHKATFGLAIALGEWVFWRISNHIDKEKLLPVFESHWAGLIDKHYMLSWKYAPECISDSIEGPKWVMIKCLEKIRNRYFAGAYFINADVSNLVMLVRHISPNKDLFDQWFSSVLTKLAKHFPAEYSRSEISLDMNKYQNELYDSTHELAIPREFFFDEEYDYSLSDNIKIINHYLNNLNYKNNQFLISPDEMLESGFVGTPYKYEPNKRGK